MKVRAIKCLCRLSDDQLFEAVGDGIALCASNARRLLEDAKTLSESDRFQGGRVLRHVAQEEAAKVLILLDAIRCPRDRQDDFSRQISYFCNHLARGIYVFATRAKPSRFQDLREWIDTERRKFYLDGPNGTDWRFYNRLLWEREASMYVDYIETDDGCQWHDPAGPFSLESSLGSCLADPIFVVIDALERVGCFPSSALRLVARKWRGIAIGDDLSWSELRDLNLETLALMKASGELQSEDPDVISTVADAWPFPLYSLNLELQK